MCSGEMIEKLILISRETGNLCGENKHKYPYSLEKEQR